MGKKKGLTGLVPVEVIANRIKSCFSMPAQNELNKIGLL